MREAEEEDEEEEEQQQPMISSIHNTTITKQRLSLNQQLFLL